MKLTIISPQEIREFSITWIELFTAQGSFIIQNEHAPTILLLQPHHAVVFELTQGKQETLLITEGVAEITRSTVTILMQQ